MLYSFRYSAVISGTAHGVAKKDLESGWVLRITPVVFEAVGSSEHDAICDQSAAAEEVCAWAFCDGHGRHVSRVRVRCSIDDWPLGTHEVSVRHMVVARK